MSHSFLAEDASLQIECLSNAVCRCLSFCALLPFPLQGLGALLTTQALVSGHADLQRSAENELAHAAR